MSWLFAVLTFSLFGLWMCLIMCFNFTLLCAWLYCTVNVIIVFIVMCPQVYISCVDFTPTKERENHTHTHTYMHAERERKKKKKLKRKNPMEKGYTRKLLYPKINCSLQSWFFLSFSFPFARIVSSMVEFTLHITRPWMKSVEELSLILSFNLNLNMNLYIQSVRCNTVLFSFNFHAVD